MNFLKESNRGKHFWAGLILGTFLTVITAIIAGVYKEFKDKKAGGKFDGLDFLATVLGGLVGQVLQVGIILLIIKMKWSFLILFANPLFALAFWFLMEGSQGIKDLWNDITSLFKI